MTMYEKIIIKVAMHENIIIKVTMYENIIIIYDNAWKCYI